MTTEKGALIAFEGLDNSGKTTQVKRLAENLQRLYPKRAVRVTAEPSNSDAGLLARDIWDGKFKLPGGVRPSAQFFGELFTLDRAHHVREFIQPWLAEGAIVLCDRYVLSTLAYQAHVRGLMELNAGFPRPDLTVFLNVSPDVAETRRMLQGKRTEVAGFLREERIAVFKAYRELLRLPGKPPTLILDGTLGPDELADAILAATLRQLQLHKVLP